MAIKYIKSWKFVFKKLDISPNDVNKYKEDPTQTLEKYDQNYYIVSLNTLKEELHNHGFNTSLIYTFKDIDEQIKNNKCKASCLTIDFNKKKSKVKVYKK